MTKKQIQAIKRIIEEHMNVIMSLTTGDGKKPSPDTLKKMGLPREVADLVTDCYKYGKLGAIKGKDLSKMPRKDVEKMMRQMKLTPAQQRAIEYSQIKTQVHLTNLQSKITSTVISLAIQDQMNMYSAVQQVIPGALENNTPRYQVIRQLRELSKDWERDWHRVAHTELWDAKVQGEAQSIMNGESPLSNKGGETRVFKRPSPMACPMCKKLYLEKGTNKPRVWKLSELAANGTNYGKKQADWKPTLGTLHPNCMCPLSVLPDGYHLDNNGDIQPDE